MNINDMLKALIKGQQSMMAEFLARFESVDKRFDSVDARLDSIDSRLDKQGAALAFLEDDAPTREEYNSLENKVKKIEGRIKN